MWGDIREELADVGVAVQDAYAILGEFDFLVVFEAETTDAAFRADVVLERHGLDVQTMDAPDRGVRCSRRRVPLTMH